MTVGVGPTGSPESWPRSLVALKSAQPPKNETMTMALMNNFTPVKRS
jgi:hypothetical protein